MLVANRATYVEKQAGFTYIGVDRGALLLLEKGIPMDYAMGDFDSISKEQLARLETTTAIIKLPVRKNESDSEYALKFALQHYDEVFICGVSGGRLDHFLALYQMLAYGKDKFTIIDEQNIIVRLDKGIHYLDKKKKYLSFLACESSVLTIIDVEYPLYHQHLTLKDTSYTISNEMKSNRLKIVIEQGSFIVIQSEDK